MKEHNDSTCLICGKPLTNELEINNGRPLVDGEVCDKCNNNYVIPYRVTLYEKFLHQPIIVLGTKHDPYLTRYMGTSHEYAKQLEFDKLTIKDFVDFFRYYSKDCSEDDIMCVDFGENYYPDLTFGYEEVVIVYSKKNFDADNNEDTIPYPHIIVNSKDVDWDTTMEEEDD